MEDLIVTTFRRVILEKEENPFIEGLGDLFPDDPPFDTNDKAILPEGNYQTFLNEIKPIMEDAVNLKLKHEYEAAMKVNLMIFHEDLILLNKTVHLSEVSQSGIYPLLFEIADRCNEEIQEILESADNPDLIRELTQWLTEELVLNKDNNEYSTGKLNELLQGLLNSSPDMLEIVSSSIEITKTPEPLELTLLKYNILDDNNEQEKIEQLLEVNTYAFSLHKRHIEKLSEAGKMTEALGYATAYFNILDQEYEEIVNLRYAQRQKRIESHPDDSMYSFMTWCSRFILFSMLRSGFYDESIQFVLEMFVNEGTGFIGRKSIMEKLELYTALKKNLPEEKQKDLAEKYFELAETMPLYFSAEKICETEDNWLPLIKALGNRISVAENFYTYGNYKQHLDKFPDELNETLKSNMSKYVKDGTNKSRRNDLYRCLRKFLKIKQSRPYILELIHEYKSMYANRKAFMEMIDTFIRENGLDEEYAMFARSN